jgi:hypothetical protein
MPFEINVVPEISVMEIRIWDKLTLENVQSMSNEVSSLARTTGIGRVLVDCRDYQGGVSLGEIYFHAKGVTERTPDTRRPQAFIAPASSRVLADVEFYALAARNRGTPVEIFPTREAAMQWLQVTPIVRTDF